MNNNPEFYIDHETRLRIQEQNSIEIKSSLKNLENRMHSNFITLIGFILTAIILPVVLHALKLT